MEQYIRSGFAGFIYDFKDFDYTRTAYNLIRKHGYPHEFYYVNFTDMNRTYRFNPLDRRNIKFPECCTAPHIVNFVMKYGTASGNSLKLNDINAMMAGAYLKAEGSEKTQASYVSTLSNYVAKLATNENIYAMC